MRWLIDGNNVLHAAADLRRGSRAGRLWVAGLLAAWAKKTGERVRVVFDGPAPRAEIETIIQRGGIDAEFSGAERSADDVIIAEIKRDTGPKHLAVVSSDRVILDAARRHGCVCTPSGAFIERVMRDVRVQPPPPDEPAQKQSGPAPDEADRWYDELDAAGEDMPDVPPY